ncbi:GNAT family N-acetyltransferase [Streptomyces sp. NPDC006552]|uniref:GNAT family N-acetyltransferase n=1 Tax=Streptomyces sp. NPDC006552 TaxID=3157179 RepID=UPI0033BD88A5
MSAQLSFRVADTGDLATLVALYDGAARWMVEQGIDQWRPGEKDEAHFRRRMAAGEVWLAEAGGQAAGGYELWWADEPAWGEQPPVAGYVHRLMVRRGAPAGCGAALLAHAERRVAGAGRTYCRLDCVADNRRLRAYYEKRGYAVVGEQPFKAGAGGSAYAVTLMEKPVTPVRPVG